MVGGRRIDRVLTMDGLRISWRKWEAREDGGRTQLAARSMWESRSGFEKTRSKPPKTISTTRIFGKAVDSEEDGLNGNGLGNGLDDDGKRGAKDSGLSIKDRERGARQHKADGG